MVITELGERDRPAWDAYVRSSAHGLPQHLSGWRDILTETYGYETHYLMAKEDGRIVGVLPMFIVRSLLVGNSATTTPGGLCADTDRVAAALIEQGRQIAQQTKVRRLVIQDARQVWPGDLHTSSSHVHRVIDVREGRDATWKQLRRETRRLVRVARKNGITVKIDRTGERVDKLHYVLCRFLHTAGAPAFGLSFLEHIVETLPDRFTVALVHKEKQPIGAYFQVLMGDTVYGMWGATLHEYLKTGGAYLAYWEILHDTATNGYHFWDLGRSPAGSNASRFKAKWGGVSRPVYQQVTSIEGYQSTDGIVDRVQTETRFRRFMQVWSKLPFPVVQFLGPRLRRHVPFA